MKALITTLIGDVQNVSVVAIIVLVTLALIGTGNSAIAPFVIPPLTLAGIAWLARR
jgi:hypothetical protein